MRFALTIRVIVGFAIIAMIPSSGTAESLNPQLRGMVANSRLNPADLSVLSAWGANSVSVQLVSLANVDDATREEYFAELSAAMDRLDLLLVEAARLKLRVLVNLYYPPGGFVNRAGGGAHRIFTDAWAQQAIIDAWSTIATRYRDNDTIWAFQLVNEPAYISQTPGLKSWSELAQTLAETIRTVDSKHYIVVNPPFGDPRKLKSLKLLTGVSNVVYAVNMYYPFSFTHQGLFGIKRNRRYPSKTATKSTMEKFLAPVKAFQRVAKTPIHIHEFSAVRWAPDGSTARWLKDAVAVIEKNKWSWAYHAFREADVWNVELTDKFGKQIAAKTKTDRLKALQTGFKRNKKSS